MFAHNKLLGIINAKRPLCNLHGLVTVQCASTPSCIKRLMNQAWLKFQKSKAFA
jgi:hypothetical protein